MLRYAVVVCVALVAFGIWANVTTAEEIGIQVSPSTINLAYEGVVVTVHADIPYRGVVTASLQLNGVEVWYTKADAQGDLVAKGAAAVVAGPHRVSVPEVCIERMLAAHGDRVCPVGVAGRHVADDVILFGPRLGLLVCLRDPRDERQEQADGDDGSHDSPLLWATRGAEVEPGARAVRPSSTRSARIYPAP